MKVKAQRSGFMGGEFPDVTERPVPTITSIGQSEVEIQPDAFPAAPRRRSSSKPPYRVPSMAEVEKTPTNARVAASTFSCAGGSTLGYRMAGFHVAAAVELDRVPAASYRLNNPRAVVLEKDVRDVTPRELLRACCVRKRELDLLDGSPPCTSFSTAGLRAKTWGKQREHAGKTQRIDDLFFEFARLLDGCQPRAFVAENVKGLGQGAAIGYFKAILRVLRECGYVVAAQLLDADLLGVPQNRERVFFVGVRADVARRLGLDEGGIHDEVFPKPLPYQYTVRDALPWLDPSAQAFSLQGTPFGDPARITSGKATPPERVKDATAPAATIPATPGKNGVQMETSVQHPGQRRLWKGTGSPAPTILADVTLLEAGRPRVVWDTQGGEGWPEPKEILDDVAPTITVGQAGRNSTHFTVEADGEVESPDGARWKRVETGDGQTVWRRKFTILEVKRLCSFPDDYLLEGTFSQQWAQLGNSVPPLMMRAVADGLQRRVFGPLTRLDAHRRVGS